MAKMGKGQTMVFLIKQREEYLKKNPLADTRRFASPTPKYLAKGNDASTLASLLAACKATKRKSAV